MYGYLFPMGYMKTSAIIITVYSYTGKLNCVGMSTPWVLCISKENMRCSNSK